MWIEIKSIIYVGLLFKSHLLREMWIEIRVGISLLEPISSHLLREMWIEIKLGRLYGSLTLESSPAGDVD